MQSPAPSLPLPLKPLLSITEVDDPLPFTRDLFQRKYGCEPPSTPHHLVAFYHSSAGDLHVVGYSHMLPFGEVYLSGGSCTDGDRIRQMPERHQALLREHGGVLVWILRYALARYANRCEAFFGHCGDARALEVTTQAGFVATPHPHLIAHWHKPLHPNIQRALIAKVHALGPF